MTDWEHEIDGWLSAENLSELTGTIDAIQDSSSSVSRPKSPVSLRLGKPGDVNPKAVPRPNAPSVPVFFPEKSEQAFTTDAWR